MRLDHQLLNNINDRLTGEILLKESHIRKDSYKVQNDNLISLRCPLHGENVLRSLIINNQEHSYHCEYPLCPAHAPGTLFDLFCTLSRVQADSAVLFWAKKFEIDINNILTQMEADAEKHKQNNDWESASSIYQQLAILFPDNTNYLEKSGDLYIQSHHQEDGVKWYLKAITQYINNKKINEAENLCDKLLQIPDISDDIYPQIADIYIDAHAENELIEYLTRLISNTSKGSAKKIILDILVSLEPQDLNLLYSKASLEKEAGQLNNLIMTYQEILRIQDNQNDQIHRLETLKSLLELQPYSIEWKTRWVMGFIEMGDILQGIEELQKAVSLWINEKNFDQAIKLIHQAQTFLPNELLLDDIYIDILVKRGQKSEALTYLRRIADQSRVNKQFDYAVKFYKKALDLGGDQPELMDTLAQLFIQEEQKEEASRLIERLAAYYFKNNQVNQAINAYQRILKLEPDNQHVRKELAVLLEKQKSSVEAVKHYLILFNEAKSSGNIDELENTGRQILALDKNNMAVMEEFLQLCISKKDLEQQVYYHRRLADISYKNNNLLKAKSHCQQILKILPLDEEALQLMASMETRVTRHSIYIRMIGDSHYINKRYDKALFEYKGLLNQYPGNISLWIRYIKTLEASKAGETEIKEAYKNLILAYVDHHQVNKALENIDLALVLSPDDVDILEIRINILREQAVQSSNKETILRLSEEINYLANLFLKSRNISKAVILFEEASALDPENQDLHLLLADVYDKSSQSEEAVAHYKILLEKSLSGKDYKTAEKAALKIVTALPEEPNAYETLINIYEKTKQTPKAIIFLEKLAVLFLNSEQGLLAQRTLNRLLRLNPLHEKAMQMLIDTESRTPRKRIYQRRIGDFYRERNNLDKAASVYEELLSQMPDNLSLLLRLKDIREKSKADNKKLKEIYNRLAEIYSARNKLQLAFEYYQKASKLDLNDIESWDNLLRISTLIYKNDENESTRKILIDILSDFANKQIELKHPEEGILHLNSILEIKPENLDIHFKLGRLYARENHFREALEHYSKVYFSLITYKDFVKAEKIGKAILELDPENSITLENQAQIYIHLNNQQEYMNTLRKLVVLYENNKNIQGLKKTCQEILRKEPEELETLRKLANIENLIPRKAVLLRKLGDLLAKAQNYQEAVQLYRQIIELLPENLSLQFRLIQSLEKSKAANEVLRDSYKNVAELYKKKSLLLKAIENYETALILDSENIEFFEEKLGLRKQLLQKQPHTSDLNAYISEVIELSDLYQKGNKLEKNISLLNDTLLLAPDNRQIKFRLSDYLIQSNQTDKGLQILFELYDSYLQENNFQESEAVAHKILLISPGNLLILERLKKLYILSGDKQKLNNIRYELATTYKAQNNIPLAKINCMELLLIVPDHIESLQLLEEMEERPVRKVIWKRKIGDILSSRKEYDSAASEFQSALKLLPENPSLMARIIKVLESAHTPSDKLKEAYLDLADKYTTRNDSEKAIELLRKYLILDPDNLDIRERIVVLKETLASVKKDTSSKDEYLLELSELASDYYESENFSKAAIYLEKLLPMGYTGKDVKEMLGYSLLGINQSEEASSYFVELLDVSIETKDTEYGIQLALDYLKHKEDKVEIISRLATLYELSGNKAKAVTWIYRLAEIAAGSGNISKARSLCKSILVLAPSNEKALLYLIETEETPSRKATWLRKLSSIYYQQKEYANSLKTIESAFELFPDNLSLLVQKVDILEITKAPESQIKETYLSLAHSCYDRELYVRAADYCDLILVLTPDDTEIMEFKLDVWGLELQRNPNDNLQQNHAAFQMELGHLYVNRNQYGRAIELLNSSLSMNPENKILQAEIAELYLKSNNETAALDYYTQIFNAYLSQNRISEETERTGLRILEIQPDNILILRQLANLYAERNDSAREKGILDKLFEIYILNKDYFQSKRVLRRILRIHENDEKACLNYIEYEKSPHRKVVLYLWLNQIYLRKKDKAQALAACEKALEMFPESPALLTRTLQSMEQASVSAEKQRNLLLKLSYVYERQGDYSQAVEILNQSISLLPDDISLYEKKREVLIHWLEAHPDEDESTHYGDFLKQLTELYIGKKEFSKALILSEEISGREPDDPGNWDQLAFLYRQTNQVEKVLVSLRRLSSILEKMEDIPRFKKVLDEIIELQPDAATIIEKRAECEFKENNVTAGVTLLKKLALIHRTSGLFEPTQDTYLRILDAAKEDLESLLNYADFLVEHGKENDAVSILLERSELFKSNGNLSRFFKIISRILDIAPDTIIAYEKLAEIYTSRGKTEDALKVYDRMARIYLDKGETEKAIETYQSALKLDSSNITLRMGIAELNEKTGNLTEAAAQYLSIAHEYSHINKWKESIPYFEQALRLSPEDPILLNEMVKAYLASRQFDLAVPIWIKLSNLSEKAGNYTEAAGLIKKALEYIPDDFDVLESLIRMLGQDMPGEQDIPYYVKLSSHYSSEGDSLKARSILEEAFGFAPLNSELQEALLAEYLKEDDTLQAARTCVYIAGLYFEKGKFKEAETIALRHQEYQSDFLEGKQFLINLYIKQNRIPEAIKGYKAIAELYINQGNSESAVYMLEKAVQLAPSNLEIREAMAEILCKSSRYQEAKKQYLDLAKIYEEKKLLDKALMIFRKVLEISPEDISLRLNILNFARLLQPEQDLIDDYMTILNLYFQKGDMGNAWRTCKEIFRIGAGEPENYIKLLGYMEKCPPSLEIGKYYSQLCEYFAKRKFYDYALQAGEKALQYEGANLKNIENLAVSYKFINNKERAKEYYRKLADLYKAQGKSSKVMDAYQSILEIDPFDILSHQSFIEAHLEQGLEEELLDDYIALGDAYIHHRDFENALSIFDKVLRIDPTNEKAYERTMTIGKLQSQPLYPPPQDNQEQPANGFSENKSSVKPESRQIPLSQDAFTSKPISALSSQLDAKTRSFLRTLELNPNNNSIRGKLIDIYLENEMHKEAFDHLLLYADSLALHNDYKQALAALQRALPLDPDNSLAKQKMSLYKSKLGIDTDTPSSPASPKPPTKSSSDSDIISFDDINKDFL